MSNIYKAMEHMLPPDILQLLPVERGRYHPLSLGEMLKCGKNSY